MTAAFRSYYTFSPVCLKGRRSTSYGFSALTDGLLELRLSLVGICNLSGTLGAGSHESCSRLTEDAETLSRGRYGQPQVQNRLDDASDVLGNGYVNTNRPNAALPTDASCRIEVQSW